MPIKSILCVFGGEQYELNAVNTAMSLALSYGAQLRVLHISAEPAHYVGLYGEGIIASSELIAIFEKENEERLLNAKTHVSAIASKYHLPLNVEDAPTHHASVNFLHLKGMVSTAVTDEGRLSDLIILAKSQDMIGFPNDFGFITPALFNTGRPVLLLPTTGDLPWRGQTIGLAWNESMEASRILLSSMSLLNRAEKVYVFLAYRTNKEKPKAAEPKLIQYLKMHDIAAEIITVGQGHHSAAEAILTKAKELKVDLLAMGAYGHSVFRETILGGFTEYMLHHADIPLILAH